jgi:hypothetical protein
MYEEWSHDVRRCATISGYDTCAVNSFRLSAEWTIPCNSAGGDRCVLHFAALGKFCCALMWTELTAHSTVLFPFT